MPSRELSDLPKSSWISAFLIEFDGKEMPALFGCTAARKQVDAPRWETANTMQGKLTGTDPDGQMLTIV